MYDRVSVHIKVSNVTHPTEVPTGKKKQDVIIVDGSGSGKCVLWEENIGNLKEGECYLLKNFVVREYGSKYLSMAKEGCEIVSIDDIGETVLNDEVLQDDKEELTDAEIVGVGYLEKYKSCLRCKGRVEPVSKGIGRCFKDECKMLQKYDKCTSYISAKLLFQSKSLVLSLYAHGQMVRDIAATADMKEVSEETLLLAPILHKVKYDHRYTITEIER